MPANETKYGVRHAPDGIDASLTQGSSPACTIVDLQRALSRLAESHRQDHQFLARVMEYQLAATDAEQSGSQATQSIAMAGLCLRSAGQHPGPVAIKSGGTFAYHSFLEEFKTVQERLLLGNPAEARARLIETATNILNAPEGVEHPPLSTREGTAPVVLEWTPRWGIGLR